MRFLYLLVLVGSLKATVISDIRAKLSAGDLWSADALAAEFCATQPSSAECAAAMSWLARGAQMMGRNDAAARYAKASLAIAEKLLQVSSVAMSSADSDPFLVTAVGASIETQARVLASEGKRDQALVLLEKERSKWNLYSLAARMQKVIHVLSLEGKSAPHLEPALKGKPVLLFLWAHWCGDCKSQVAALAEVRRQYGERITILAPTRLYGSVGANTKASAAEEEAEIARVWRESYGALDGVAHPVDEEMMRAYGVSSTPTLVLADRKGFVRLYRPSRLSAAELSHQVAQILQH